MVLCLPRRGGRAAKPLQCMGEEQAVESLAVIVTVGVPTYCTQAKRAHTTGNPPYPAILLVLPLISNRGNSSSGVPAVRRVGFHRLPPLAIVAVMGVRREGQRYAGLALSLRERGEAVQNRLKRRRRRYLDPPLPLPVLVLFQQVLYGGPLSMASCSHSRPP